MIDCWIAIIRKIISHLRATESLEDKFWELGNTSPEKVSRELGLRVKAPTWTA